MALTRKSDLDEIEAALERGGLRDKGVDRTQRELLDKLAELGGKLVTDETIVRQGTKLVLPESMTPQQGVQSLMAYIKAEEAETVFTRVFRYRPWDGAYALTQVVKKHFGFMIGTPTPGMFGDRPPQMVTINIGVNETAQVPWGQVALPFLPGATLTLSSTYEDDGPLFALSVAAPRKYRNHIEGLFKLIEIELQTNSIYRAKAIDGREQANFVDLSGVRPERIVYSDEVMDQLDANVWSLLRYTSEQEAAGLPLKRAVLFTGPYGTGKTEGAKLTAKIAVDNGWTFIMARPGQDDLLMVMQTARLYQPAVVFFEDVDQLETSDATQISQLLDVFDGIAAKGTKIVAILTTNHPQKLHKGLLRPGRLDAVIHMEALDRNGVERMVRALVPATLLGEVDYDAVWTAMEGYLPAFVKEAVDRAKRYSLAHNKGTLLPLTTADFVSAATGLRPQFELMQASGEGKPAPELETQFRQIVGKTVVETLDPGFLSPAARKQLGTTR